MTYGQAFLTEYFLTPNPTVKPTAPGWWVGTHANGLDYVCRIVRRGKRLVAVLRGATAVLGLDDFKWVEETTAPWDADLFPANPRRAV